MYFVRQTRTNLPSIFQSKVLVDVVHRGLSLHCLVNVAPLCSAGLLLSTGTFKQIEQINKWVSSGGGYSVERWVCGCVQIGCPFGLSGLPMVSFLFENWLDIGRFFAKCLIFDDVFLQFTYRLSKNTYTFQFRW